VTHVAGDKEDHSISLGYNALCSSKAYAIAIPTKEYPDLLLGFLQHNKAPDRAPQGHSLVTFVVRGICSRPCQPPGGCRSPGTCSGQDLWNRQYDGAGARRTASFTAWRHHDVVVLDLG